MANKSKSLDTSPAPMVVDGKDQEVFPAFHKLVSRNQYGSAPGHYVKVLDNTLAAVGVGTEPESTFKIYSSLVDLQTELNILASYQHPNTVVAVDKGGDGKYRVVLKELPEGYVQSLTNFRGVKQEHPEILFKKAIPAGSEFCSYVSIISDSKPIILGFDREGHLMDPTQVEMDTEAAKLRIHEAQEY
ncbi:uncharacterized protein LOC116617332 [Nematostella vectensis]|uniref:uncharacterized protein LOC116617332 n=1 Tax=Nematostella vectensis TaxID=45351 RepID=UPI00139066BC|nr:uncharacterized protein LOC116617332 [Nematostella vectensis]